MIINRYRTFSFPCRSSATIGTCKSPDFKPWLFSSVSQPQESSLPLSLSVLKLQESKA